MRLWVLGLAAALTACSTSSGRDFDLGSAKNIRPGLTTKAQVVSYLGQPYTRVSSNGIETWTYSYSVMNPKLGAQAFVPFVGGLLPGAFSADTNARNVNVTFNNNIVSACQLSASSGQSSSGGGIAGIMSMMTPEQSIESSDCSGHR